MEINDLMLNPVRMRIIQAVAAAKQSTASDICQKIPDIPRTTVYRHIRLLIENDLLTVVSEKKVRGSMERTLALNVAEIARHNTLENASQNALAFLMNCYGTLEKYFSGPAPDPARDRIFLNSLVLMASDAEFDGFLQELQTLLQKYSVPYAKGRRPRNLSVISAPGEE